jgi:pimeloyl-ACP methyl ester carboxylesterase
MRLTVDGKDVFVATGGKPFDAAKPTVMFVHGAGCDRTGWVLPARWFAHHGWSVLAPDLPGHGLSKGAPLTSVADMAAWVERLLDAAGLPAAALVGHSMGGAIALETAAHAPGRVTALALVGTAATIAVGPALLEAAQKTPDAAYDMMTAWGIGAAAKRGGNAVPGLWLSGGVRRVFGLNAPGVLATDLAACAAWTTGPAAAARITCPTTVVTAALDLMTPAKKGEDLAKLIAGARLTKLGGVGHMIMAEAPDAFLDALIAGLTPTKKAA